MNPILQMFVAYIISYCFHVLYFMQSYMFVYCRALLVPPLYVCFIGRETLCCLCLNKRFCIVLYCIGNMSHDGEAVTRMRRRLVLTVIIVSSV